MSDESARILFSLAERSAFYSELLNIACALMDDDVMSREDAAQQIINVAHEMSKGFVSLGRVKTA